MMLGGRGGGGGTGMAAGEKRCREKITKTVKEKGGKITIKSTLCLSIFVEYILKRQ